MPKLIATVGGLIICAGIDLLWQSRHQIHFWLETFANFLSALRRRQLPARILSSGAHFLRRQAALRILLGLGLTFVLGPLFLVVSLTLLFHPQ
jgi:hypothetical protein